MMELTKDDLYEIEKALDIYAGQINDTINRYCQTAIHLDAIKKPNVMQPIIYEYVMAKNRILEIRKKLATMRGL